MGKQRELRHVRKTMRKEANRLNDVIVLRFFASLEHEKFITRLKICKVILFGSKKKKLELNKK